MRFVQGSLSHLFRFENDLLILYVTVYVCNVCLQSNYL